MCLLLLIFCDLPCLIQFPRFFPKGFDGPELPRGESTVGTAGALLEMFSQTLVIYFLGHNFLPHSGQ
jgi:hypothetical protein